MHHKATTQNNHHPMQFITVYIPTCSNKVFTIELDRQKEIAI